MDYVNDVPNAPKAIGPYSQAVIAEPFVYLSGQIPINPSTGKLIDGGIEEQATQVLKNIQTILNHLGLSFANCVKATIFLTDLANFQKVNAIYGDCLGDFKPARSTIQVAGLPMGAMVEIEMIAKLR